MAAMAEVNGPVNILLYEALLEAGFSPDALSDLRSSIADGVRIGSDDGDPQSLPLPGDDRVSLFMSGALSIVGQRGASAREILDGSAAFVALGFTPFASAALHHIRLQALRKDVLSAMDVATTHIRRHIASFDVTDADLSSCRLHIPEKGQWGYMQDTSADALRSLRLHALTRIELLASMGFSLAVAEVKMWRMALRYPLQHWHIFGGHTDAWHDAMDIIQVNRRRFAELGFTTWVCEALNDWVDHSSGHMSCAEAAFTHINLHTRAIYGVVDAPPTYSAKDASVQSEWAGCSISTRVLSLETSATVDSFCGALASFVRPLEQDGCTLFFHATTSLALAEIRDMSIDFGAGGGALDFNSSKNGFYITKLPTQAASWALAKSRLMRSHPGSPNPNACPAVVVYRLVDDSVRTLHRLQYNLSEPFDAVGSVPEGAPLTAPDLIRECRLGVGTTTTEKLVHWIEGPQLLNTRDAPESWRFGGHQVCVMRAEGLGLLHCDDAEDMMEGAFIAVCLATVP